MAANEAPLAISRDGDVAIIRLARPQKRNALNDAMVLALESAFGGLDGTVCAALLCADGAHFSAGLDLADLVEKDVAAAIEHSRMWHRAFEAIEFGRVPVVAVLQGAVVGGGLELAAAAHVRVAERSAYYGLPEGQRGIYVGGGGSVRLPRLIGASRMMDMMLTGRIYSADEGLAMGLSHYLVDDGDGFAKGMDLARKIAGNAPLTNFALVQGLPRMAAAEPGAAYLMEALLSAIAQDSAEAKDRLRAFLDKRAGKIVPRD